VKAWQVGTCGCLGLLLDAWEKRASTLDSQLGLGASSFQIQKCRVA
jgi:hypothetical protein